MNVEWVVFEKRLDREAATIGDGPLVFFRHKIGTVRAEDAANALRLARFGWRRLSVDVQSRLAWDLDVRDGTVRP